MVGRTLMKDETPMSNRLPELPPDAFLKEDAGDDGEFYAPARPGACCWI